MKWRVKVYENIDRGETLEFDEDKIYIETQEIKVDFDYDYFMDLFFRNKVTPLFKQLKD